MHKDADYYTQRALSELQLARTATTPAVVSAHYRLSTLYLERAQALMAEPGRASRSHARIA